VSDGQTVGVLPLAFVRSRLFGRYLVSVPYLNTGGVVAGDDAARAALVDEAVELAGRLDVKHLELRHEEPVEHPALGDRLTSKVHGRLGLPGEADELWSRFKPKVRNQVRKGEKEGLTVHWGREELLGEFYRVFAHNMRDLGTPVFSRRLFRSILARFPDWSELCVVRLASRPVAAALLVHGPGMTEVPSASSLRRYNATCANMLMYWHLLQRSIGRGQAAFDFGRSTVDSGTFRFKSQWGAEPSPAVWQYHVRRGSMGDLRPDNPRYRLMIAAWQRLPVWLARWIGPPIVRGIP
jgi:FemAB-related protein (PEP-CTERM system-associated)